MVPCSFERSVNDSWGLGARHYSEGPLCAAGPVDRLPDAESPAPEARAESPAGDPRCAERKEIYTGSPFETTWKDGYLQFSSLG